MKKWTKFFTPFTALLLLNAGCVSGHRDYEASSGNLLTLEVLSAQQASPDQAMVSVCYELPSDADWVLGRLLGDVTLSDGQVSAAMDHFELLATVDNRLTRCDRLFFTRPGGFPPGVYSLTIIRLAASIPAEPDWAALESTLADAAPGLVIEPLPGQSGLSFGLIGVPAGMTDAEAANLVLGLAEPVVVGPWSIRVEIQE